MPDFVTVLLDADPASLLDTGIDQINTTLDAAGYPGWAANDGTLAVIILSTIAQIAADVAQVAATCVPAIFRAFGTQLLGIPYQQGVQATIPTNWTFTSPAPSGGYLIPGGTAVVIDGFAFYAQNDLTTATSATSAQITLIASQNGTTYNDLGGDTVVADLVEGIDFVSSVTCLGISSGGADQETDDDYQNKLARTLTLMAPRPITTSDYAGMVLSDLAESATGVAVGRATSIDAYYPDGRLLSTGGAGSTVLTCTTVSSSPTITINTPTPNQVPSPGATVTGTGIPAATTVLAVLSEQTFTITNNATASGGSVSLTISAMSGYGPVHAVGTCNVASGSPTVALTSPPYTGAIPDVGARVTGTNIPAGATVLASPAPTTTSFTLSANATGSATGETVTVSSWTQFAKAVTTFVTDVSGNALSAANMDTLQAWLQSYRQNNDLPIITLPSYSTIYVAATIKVLPGFDKTAVTTNVQNSVLAWLNPATWGNPNVLSTGSTSWLNRGDGYNIVRWLKSVAIVENVPGVDYASAVTIGFSGGGLGTTDLTLNGPAPLPQSSSGTVAITAL